MKWLNDTRGTFMHTYQDNDRYIVYARKKSKPLLIMEKVEDDSGLITLHLISGSMIKSNQKKQGRI